MPPGVLRQGPNLATAFTYSLNENASQQSLHRASSPAWRSLRRKQLGRLTHRIQTYRNAPNRGLSFTAAAAASAAAANVFADDENPWTVLKRRAQLLITSPYDKEIWAVALPALVAMLLEPVMNAINAGLVGHLGTQQLSAMSLGGLAVSFCTFFYTFLLFLTVPEIAAAAVKRDEEEVSRIVAKSLWISVVCGFTSAAAMFVGAEAIVGMLKPPEAAVAAFAVDFIKIRSLGIPAVLLGFVANAVFRGFRDTRTPLFGALLSAAVSLGLNVLFLYVFRMGVVGSAVASTVAQLVSNALLLGALLGGGKVQPRHLVRPPPLAAVVPTMKLGAVLGARNLISFGMVIYASALSIRLGATHQAAFEVIRQMWLLAIQFFECLNVATQALCASYLGKEDRVSAKQLLNRLMTLAVAVGALAGAAVWLLHEPFIAFFTQDQAVVNYVLSALPIICLFFPIDAAAAIMDGSLLAAKQSNYMSAVQIAGSVVQYFVLAYLAATNNISSLSVWSALKILVILRVVGGVVRNYLSNRSGYTTVVAGAAVAVAAPSPVVAATEPPLPPAAGQRAAAVPSGDVASMRDEGLEPLEEAIVSPVAAEVATAAPPSEAAATAAAALQSIEDDVRVLAYSACTAATDMNPDMLSLKRRQVLKGADGAAGNNGGGGGGGDGGGGDGSTAATTSVPTSSTLATAAGNNLSSPDAG